jgi:tetratricopeptide (TPR) repeat protein
MSSPAGDQLERARDASGRGDWKEAFDLLTQADAAGALTPPDLPFLGEVAYAAGDLDATIDAWERAHAAAAQAGDNVAAAGAAVRVAMHLLFDTALMAPVRGWLRRADSLLEGLEDTPAHAWRAVVRTYERMLSGDVEGARPWAESAVGIGSRFDPAAAAIGRVAHARVLILSGDVAEGRALLDEAGVATISGDLDPMSKGVVYCELVCALQGLAQYDAAEEWTEAMERWSKTGAIGSIHGRCRVHRAEILRLRGSHQEAEKEVLAACEELRPYLRREMGWPLNELGRIRLDMGDIPGADEALSASQAAGWDPQPGLALVRLARGDVVAAAVSIEAALESPIGVPSKERPPNTDLARAPLLEAQVEIEIAAGDLLRASAAAQELAAIAQTYQSKVFLTSAAAAEAKVRRAQADAPTARSTGAPSFPDVAEFRREGDYWSVLFAGRTVRVRDLKGLRYLARLLASPGREHHALDLVAAESGAGASRVPLGDAGEILDEKSKSAYRRRLAEIDEDIDDATAAGDGERVARSEAEREFLIRELSGAVGLGGRDRRAASSSERARAGVTRAIRQGIARISEHHRGLGEHLEHAIRTGTYCGYFPDPHAPIEWRV